MDETCVLAPVGRYGKTHTTFDFDSFGSTEDIDVVSMTNQVQICKSANNQAGFLYQCVDGVWSRDPSKKANGLCATDALYAVAKANALCSAPANMPEPCRGDDLVLVDSANNVRRFLPRGLSSPTSCSNEMPMTVAPELGRCAQATPELMSELSQKEKVSVQLDSFCTRMEEWKDVRPSAFGNDFGAGAPAGAAGAAPAPAAPAPAAPAPAAPASAAPASAAPASAASAAPASAAPASAAPASAAPASAAPAPAPAPVTTPAAPAASVQEQLEAAVSAEGESVQATLSASVGSGTSDSKPLQMPGRQDVIQPSQPFLQCKWAGAAKGKVSCAIDGTCPRGGVCEEATNTCSVSVAPSDALLDGNTTFVGDISSSGEFLYMRNAHGGTTYPVLDVQRSKPEKLSTVKRRDPAAVVMRQSGRIDGAVSSNSTYFHVMNSLDPHSVFTLPNGIQIKGSGDEDEDSMRCMQTLCSHNVDACPQSFCTLVTEETLAANPALSEHAGFGECVPKAFVHADKRGFLADALLQCSVHEML